MTAWNKSAKWKRTRVAQILKRDGRQCWLCGYRLSATPRKHTKRMTLEHLTPRCLGGGDGIDNLVICHDHCNRHLAGRPRKDKEKMRVKWHAARQRDLARAKNSA